MELTGPSPASSRRFICPRGTQDMREGFHNPPPTTPKGISFSLERKVERGNKDMTSPGTGHFKQTEAPCSRGSLWITIGRDSSGSYPGRGVNCGHQQGALDHSPPQRQGVIGRVGFLALEERQPQPRSHSGESGLKGVDGRSG